MAGIAGILKPGEHDRVSSMLDKIIHRGNYSSKIVEFPDATIGIVWSFHENERVSRNLETNMFIDGPGHGHLAFAAFSDGTWSLGRDELGVAPMYYTYLGDDSLCFASEVKALVPCSPDISELLPGCLLNHDGPASQYELTRHTTLDHPPELIASDLLHLLSISVGRRINTDPIGSWLSGGLDSSTIAALAKPWVKSLHTFCGGVKDSPDLEFAREVAGFIGSTHHEVVITVADMIKVLPRLIYHLESFDAWLVRSSIVNFLVAQYASDHVREVFSGEGGDELFAGYSYLKNLPEDSLEDELVDITKRLHNTALQRVDRCASAFGATAHVVFADPEVVEYAIKVPVRYKLHDGVEKWILRKAVKGILPDRIVKRGKAKFWEGAGVGELLAEFTERMVTDKDFRQERKLENGWILNTKEELYYYRLFREAFGQVHHLDWMGRSKGSPKT